MIIAVSLAFGVSIRVLDRLCRTVTQSYSLKDRSYKGQQGNIPPRYSKHETSNAEA